MSDAKRLRKNNFSSDEICTLLEEINVEKRVLLSSLTTDKKKFAVWSSIAEKVSGCGVAVRTGPELNDKWKSLKSETLRRKDDMQRTGGGPPKKASPWEELVEKILGEESALLYGITSAIPDVFQSQTQQLSSSATVRSSRLHRAMSRPQSTPSSTTVTGGSLSMTQESMPPCSSMEESNDFLDVSNVPLLHENGRVYILSSNTLETSTPTADNSATTSSVDTSAVTPAAGTSASSEPSANIPAQKNQKRKKSDRQIGNNDQNKTSEETDAFIAYCRSVVSVNAAREKVLCTVEEKLKLEQEKMKLEIELLKKQLAE